jgi:hypothetical protein
MGDIIQGLTKENTQWMEELFFTMKLTRKKMCKCYAELTPNTDALPIVADIVDPLEKLQSLWK